MCMAFFFLQALGWRMVLSRLGGSMNYGPAMSTWFSSQAAKYVPGKVMLPLIRVTWAGRAGVPKSAVLLSILIEIVLMLISATLIFFALAPFLTQGLDNTWALVAVVVCCVGGGIAIHPRVMNWALNLALKAAKREPIVFDFPYRALLPLLLLFTVAWLLFGLSAALCVSALDLDVQMNGPMLAAITAGFVISWEIGFLSFVTPGGLGVREGVLTLILSPFLTAQTAMAVALLSRLIWMACEAIGALVLLPFRPRSSEGK
jgi:glycosyltransferase 2 family protein